MVEVKGKYASAKIFTDVVDEGSINQVTEMLNQPFANGETVRMMPDIHVGSGCTIGTTMTVSRQRICPNLVGVDIGCGMYAVKLYETDIDFDELDKTIRQFVPSGFNIHDRPNDQDVVKIEDLKCVNRCNIHRARCSIGTLGGGNHFIEVDRDSSGKLWLVIHSGSRHLGLEVAKYYQELAIHTLHRAPKDEAAKLIEKLKSEGRQREIQDALRQLKSPYANVPDSLCWVSGKDFEDYVHDMKITQEFAVLNRVTIAEIIMNKMKLHKIDGFTTIHNYLDTDAMILRKGAVRAKSGERLIIPINMRDGSLICKGKGNPDWNFSAPHGAGRIMSRAEARKTLSMDEFKRSMNGVWTSSVDTTTIDEAPMAYKSISSIIENIGGTVEIDDIIKPVYNFKASE